MRLPVLILRPEPGAASTLHAAQALGLKAMSFPLFHVETVEWEPIARDRIDAILLGSANAVRHAGPNLAQYRGIPVYAVGQTTAQAARDAGLEVIATGRGGLQNMLNQLQPSHRTLLRLAGKERVELHIPADVTVYTREVYASIPQPMPERLQALLQAPALVLLHSGEAAAHFAHLCINAGINRRHIALATIGPRVSARAAEGWAAEGWAAEGWAALCHAENPSDAALLALAERMCQDCGFEP